MVLKVALPYFKHSNLSCKTDARKISILYGITQPTELIMYMFFRSRYRVRFSKACKRTGHCGKNDGVSYTAVSRIVVGIKYSVILKGIVGSFKFTVT